MVNAQEWLDFYYPKENRENITELNIRNKNLEGSLDLSDFVNLEKLSCFSNQLTFLDLKTNTKLIYLSCGRNQLNSLDVSANAALQKIYCNQNQITSLDVSVNLTLTLLHCHSNQLVSLNLTNNLKLESLSISNNNFLEQDLSSLSHLVSLRKLWLENEKQERISQSVYNRFTGSLELLKKMNELETLNISNTDIDGGLEYLPDSLRQLDCLADKRKDAKCQVIYNLFANEQGIVETEEKDENGNEYIKNFPQKFQLWKQINPDLIITRWKKEAEEAKEKITELEEELKLEREEAKEAMQASQRWRERQLREITEQKDREIEELKKQVSQLQQQNQAFQVQPTYGTFPGSSKPK